MSIPSRSERHLLIRDELPRLLRGDASDEHREAFQGVHDRLNGVEVLGSCRIPVSPYGLRSLEPDDLNLI